MLEHPANQIIRHADIKNAVRSIGQNVNVPAACHAEILQDVDGRDKPGHDDDGYILCPTGWGMTVCLGKARAAYPAPTAFLRQARCAAQLQPGGCDATASGMTSLAGVVDIGGDVGIASLTRRSCVDWSCAGM
jgi:hypothetical protein